MKRALYAGLSALILLAACSKQEPAAPAPVADPDAEDMVSQHAPAKPPKPKDWNKMATGMTVLLADAPECQKYKDELLAIAQTPVGGTPPRDPALVVAEAHDNHCSKKSREQ